MRAYIDVREQEKRSTTQYCDVYTHLATKKQNKEQKTEALKSTPVNPLSNKTTGQVCDEHIKIRPFIL